MRPQPLSVWKARRTRDQRVALERILVPGREQLADPGDLLAGLLYDTASPVPGRCSTSLAPIRGWQTGAASGPRHGSWAARRRPAARAPAQWRRHRPAARWRRRPPAPAAAPSAPRACGICVSACTQVCGVVEHVPGIRAPGLQRLHVVLEADDRVRQAVEVARRHAVPPGCITRLSCVVMPSMISTARALPSISRPALMPRIRSCQLSSAPHPACRRRSEAMASLTRARLTLHSRSTAACTCWNSASLDSAGASVWRLAARSCRPARRSSRSSTLISVAAMCTSAARRPSGLAGDHGLEPAGLLLHQLRAARPGRARRACRRSCAACSTCESSSAGWPAAAHEDVQHVLDLAEVLADRRRHGLHQLDATARRGSRAPARRSRRPAAARSGGTRRAPR